MGKKAIKARVVALRLDEHSCQDCSWNWAAKLGCWCYRGSSPTRTFLRTNPIQEAGVCQRWIPRKERR
jgi:hypothetical protein